MEGKVKLCFFFVGIVFLGGRPFAFHFHSHCFLSCCVLCGGFISPWFLFNSTPREMPVSAFFVLFCFACSFLIYVSSGCHSIFWGKVFTGIPGVWISIAVAVCYFFRVFFILPLFQFSSTARFLKLCVILALASVTASAVAPPFFKEDYFGGALIGS